RKTSRNGKSLSWMGLTRERWCCTKSLIQREGPDQPYVKRYDANNRTRRVTIK
ncbi:unnamed protein product, partial [Ascophyllum nodosum]